MCFCVPHYLFVVQALCAQGGQLTYDPSCLTQNGVAAQHMIPAAYNRYASQPLSTYPLHSPAHWPMQYVMHAPPQVSEVSITFSTYC